MRIILFLSLSVACTAVLACTQHENTGIAGTSTSPSRDGRPPDSFFESRRVYSFEEAERVTGYPIPRHERLPVVNDTIFLSVPPNAPGLPMVSYSYQVGDGRYVYIDVVPPTAWQAGPPSLNGQLDGRWVSLGGWEGIVLRDDAVTTEFAFPCGDIEEGQLWCVANAPEQDAQELSGFLVDLLATSSAF